MRSKIIGTGAYIPELIIDNDYFLGHTFYGPDKKMIVQPQETIIRKFREITGISQRRYAAAGITSSDMGAMAAEEAIEKAQIDREDIDLIVVAHNYGDMSHNGAPRDMVPSVASRVKHKLGIKNPNCIAYDVIFGCPGWLHALIQADLYIQTGRAVNCLVIGSETLSRVLDPNDRDSLIFSDGAGATLVQKTAGDNGLFNSATITHSFDEIDYIVSAEGVAGEVTDPQFIRMKGRKVYEYALKHVPQAMKDCFDSSGQDIKDLKMIFIHQANEKMDEAIVKRFFELYGISELPDHIMPMNIGTMGNSSVATIPTLLNQVLEGELPGYSLGQGDIILFASVGAGMNINAATYKF